jgi:hypothetical protein
MAKYKVGDELVIINDPTEEKRKLKEEIIIYKRGNLNGKI